MQSADPSAWVVHKFGGSSVADAECFKRVANILETLPPGRLGWCSRPVAASPMHCSAWSRAPKRRTRPGAVSSTRLRTRHNTIAEALLTADARQLYMAGFDRDRHDIEGILHTVKLTRSAAQNVRDLIAGYGEIWSTKLFREFFVSRGKRPGDVKWIDARQAVVVEWGPLGPAVQWDESRAKLSALVGSRAFNGTLIITGFIASRPARRADDPRAQRQRLLRIDLRLAARRERDPHLDRRRWRAVGRSAPRARRQGHRLAVVQRSHGARVLRRQGDPPADDGAGRRPRHPHLDPQHLRAAEAGLADLREARLQTTGQGHHQHREHRDGERGGRRHDRRARHGASPVRRAA